MFFRLHDDSAVVGVGRDDVSRDSLRGTEDEVRRDDVPVRVLRHLGELPGRLFSGPVRLARRGVLLVWNRERLSGRRVPLS